jgi:hypothetical protein
MGKRRVKKKNKEDYKKKTYFSLLPRHVIEKELGCYFRPWRRYDQESLLEAKRSERYYRRVWREFLGQKAGTEYWSTAYASAVHYQEEVARLEERKRNCHRLTLLKELIKVQ